MSLIDKDKLKEYIKRVSPCGDSTLWSAFEVYGAIDTQDIINITPATHAMWQKSSNLSEGYVCSNCGGAAWYHAYSDQVAKSKYCPNCGAKMNMDDPKTKEILRFIARFTSDGKNTQVIDTFTNGCCFWFAEILGSRFRDQKPVMMYDQIMNHFGMQINYRVYDITGDVTDQYTWEPWLKIDDELLRARVIRDCVDFVD